MSTAYPLFLDLRPVMNNRRIAKFPFLILAVAGVISLGVLTHCQGAELDLEKLLQEPHLTILEGKLADIESKMDGDVMRGHIAGKKTLLSTQAGHMESVPIKFYGKGSEKSLGLQAGSEGIWFLLKSEDGYWIKESYQFLPLAEKEALLDKLQATLVTLFENQLAVVSETRTSDPTGNAAETVAAVKLLMTRFSQLGRLGKSGPRLEGGVERLREILKLYDRDIDFPISPKTKVEEAKLMDCLRNAFGRAPSPDASQYASTLGVANMLLISSYDGFMDQTISADEKRFARMGSEWLRELKLKELPPDLVETFKSRAASLQYLIDNTQDGTFLKTLK
jgi:hypothetical protein